VHVLGVDGRHHKRAAPALGQFVPLGFAVVGLGRACEARREGKRVGQGAGQFGVGAGLLHRGNQTGCSATRKTALHDLDPPVHALQRLAELLLRQVLEVDHAEVKGDGVEPAREHDASAAGRRRALQLGNHLRHPAGLATQVHIVGARGRAGSHQGIPVQLVGAHGGDDHLGLRHQLGHGLRRRWRRPLTGAGSAGMPRSSRTFASLACAAPSHGPAHGVAGLGGGAAGAVSGVQVFGYQAAGEAGGAEDDEVVGLGHTEWSHRPGCFAHPMNSPHVRRATRFDYLCQAIAC
jgi:hypothetical protein